MPPKVNGFCLKNNEKIRGYFSNFYSYIYNKKETSTIYGSLFLHCLLSYYLSTTTFLVATPLEVIILST